MNEPYYFEEPQDKKLFDAEVVFTLYKKTKIATSDYIETEWCDCERDEDGYVCKTGGVDCDTSGVDWNNDYKKEHYTITEMLEQLKEYISEELKTTNKRSQRYTKLTTMMSDLDGWEETLDIC